jgi:hypothetical protein
LGAQPNRRSWRSQVGIPPGDAFNLCVGNTDNHAKNHALLYAKGGAPYFAPLYDLLPIRIDDRYNHQLAYNVGAAEFFDDMTSEDLTSYAQCGVEDVSEFVEKLARPMLEKLEAATPILRSQNQKNFDDNLRATALAKNILFPVPIPYSPKLRINWKEQRE